MYVPVMQQPLMEKVRREAKVIEAEKRLRLDQLRELLNSDRGDFRQRAQWREEIIRLHERW